MPQIDQDHRRRRLPSERVHMVSNRLGLVVAGCCLLVAIVLAVASLFSNSGMMPFAISWGVGAVAFYLACRALGWIIAGAMPE